MKNIVKKVALILSSVILMSSLVSCKNEEQAAKIQTVNLCEVTHSVFYAPQYVAIEEGFFEDEGIKIELTTGDGADNVMAATISGSVDIGFAGPEAAIYVYNEGKDDYSKVFAQLTQKDGSFLVSREKYDNFTWDKIKGKTVLPGRVGGVPYMSLEYVIKENGIDPKKDTNLDSSIDFSLMTSAFVNGTGDFVTAFEPVASTLEKEGQGYVASSIGEQSGNVAYTTYFASQSYLKENAKLIEGFTKAIYKAQQWVQEHSASEIATIIAPQFETTDIELLTSSIQRYKDIGAYCLTPEVSKEGFEHLQEIMIKAGELQNTVEYNKIVDSSIAQKIIK